MTVLHIELDAETYRRLVEQAVIERRPIEWQAEVALRRAMGLPFPPDDAATPRPRAGDGGGRE